MLIKDYGVVHNQYNTKRAITVTVDMVRPLFEQGLSDREIAAELETVPRTVEHLRQQGGMKRDRRATMLNRSALKKAQQENQVGAD